VAHWTFDTDLSDALGVHHGVGHGRVKIVQDAAVGAGALSVGGRPGDYVKIPARPGLPGGSFSLLYWVRSDPKIESSIGGMCRRITGFDAHAFETDWNVHSPSWFEIRWWNGSWHSALAAPAKGRWLHFAWTYDAKHQMLGLHVNARQVSLTPKVRLRHAGHSLYLGGSYRGVQNFKGTLDDLRLYSRVLGAEEIRPVVGQERPGTAPGAAEGTVRFDFESGGLQGWRVIEGKFAKLLNDRTMFRNRRGLPFNKQGRHFLDTVEAGGDRQTGTVESPVFVLRGPTMSMLVGGGRHPDTYVALCTLDGEEALKAQGPHDEVLVRVNWHAPQLVGKRVFLRIVDGHTTGWGHVTFDDFTAQGKLDPAATRQREALAAAQLQQRRLRKQFQAIGLDALRLAIHDLMAAFPERYTRGAEFLGKIDACRRQVDEVTGALARNEKAAIAQVARLLDDVRSLRREALLANPLLAEHPILFVVRHQYRSDHHNTATLFQTGEINTSKFQGGAALKAIDFGRGGQVRTLLHTDEGAVRDPEVHFSAGKIVFSMRRNARDDYHIYEVNADGSGLRQITFAPGVSDIDPLYLPDDDIAFSSTREPKYCMCNRHIMANLFRMSPDGANIHQIGKSTLFEGHGCLLPDGRILYDRWEYVDRNFGDAQGLWTANPDGTNHAIYWGNNTASPGAVLDARPIAGTGQVVCTLSSCHDRPWGAMAILDPRRGIDADRGHKAPIVRTWPPSARDLVGVGNYDTFKKVRPRYEDPFPLSARHFLCTRTTGAGEQTGIYLVDVYGNEVLLHAEPSGCFDPMPLAPRARPAAPPARRGFGDGPGYFYVHDVYEGTHMKGVKRGDVKWLRVVESPEKRFWVSPRWTGQGTMAPAMNWHDFNNKRILGTAPVDRDGSAYFAAPSDKFVFFQLLDESGMMIQSMRSGTMVQPGERTGCVGCHEDRLAAPALARPSLPQAVQRPASRLEGWQGPPRLFSYQAEVQPVWDRHCLGCHDFGKKGAKKLVLAGDRTETFCVSYNELWRKKYIKAIGAGPAQIQQARSWGSHASKLVEVLRQGHHDVRLDRESFDRIVTWIDLNAPYYPTYASAYPKNMAGRCPLDGKELGRLGKLTGLSFQGLASCRGNLGPQITFDRPEQSPCLKPIAGKDSAAYKEALAIIETGRQRLAKSPRGDMSGFRPCPVDQQREAKYQQRQQAEARSRAAISRNAKAYDPRPAHKPKRPL